MTPALRAVPFLLTGVLGACSAGGGESEASRWVHLAGSQAGTLSTLAEARVSGPDGREITLATDAGRMVLDYAFHPGDWKPVLRVGRDPEHLQVVRASGAKHGPTGGV